MLGITSHPEWPKYWINCLIFGNVAQTVAKILKIQNAYIQRLVGVKNFQQILFLKSASVWLLLIVVGLGRLTKESHFFPAKNNLSF